MKLIYKKTKHKNLSFQHVCEVGVYLPETSNIVDFIKRDHVRATLVEANPAMIEKIKTYFANDNIQLFPYAVWDYNGTLKLSKANASTFVSELSGSPALINDGYRIEETETFEVPCRKFDELDSSNIDLISIDIEGSEWYALQYMKSRPKIIAIETHGKYYINPFIKEILEWTQRNNYSVWYKDGSDTVFVRNDIFEPTFWEQTTLAFTNFRLYLRRLKRFVRK